MHSRPAQYMEEESNKGRKSRRASIREGWSRRTSSIDHEELQRRRQASVAVVKAAMQEAKDKQEQRRLKMMPMRRFGCKLVVMLFHHQRNRQVQRKIVVMEDNIKWGPGPTQFQGWAEVCMGLPGAGMGQNQGLSFQYFNEFCCAAGFVSGGWASGLEVDGYVGYGAQQQFMMCS